jgi:hypothetical protein
MKISTTLRSESHPNGIPEFSTSREVLNHLEKNPDDVLSVRLADHGARKQLVGGEVDIAVIDTGLAAFLDPEQGDGYNGCYFEPTGFVVSIRVFRNLLKAKLIKEVATTEDCGVGMEHYRPRTATKRRKK